MKTDELLKPKVVSWPIEHVKPSRNPATEPCSVHMVKYEPQSIDGGILRFSQNIAVQLIDMQDRAIYNEVIRAAGEAGIDDLYLMDKQFVLDALREKLEREGYGKNT